MSFVNSFEKTALLPMPEKVEDLSEKAMVLGYGIQHSPVLAAAKAAIKWGVPAAALSAIFNPAKSRLMSALIGGGAIGGLAGAIAYGDKQYDNLLERSHLLYHMRDE